MRIGVIVFKHDPSECPIASLSEKLPSISLFTQIDSIEKRTYNATIYINASASNLKDVITKIQKVVPYHKRVKSYDSPKLYSGFIKCSIKVEDAGIKDSIIRCIERTPGVSLHPFLLHETVDGVGSITAKFKNDNVFKELLDKFEKSDEVELIKEKCNVQAPNINEPFLGLRTKFDLFFIPEQKEFLWEVLRKGYDINIFEEFEESPLLQIVLQKLYSTFSKFSSLVSFFNLLELFFKFWK